MPGAQAADMPVAIVKYDGTLGALRKAVELSSGFDKLRPDSKVLLKPNIAWSGRASKKSPKFGTITTSRIIEDLVQLLHEQGCGNISVGEGTVVNNELGSSTFRGYKLSGIDRVAKKYGLKLIDFHKEPYRRVPIDGVAIAISATVLESDFLINIPVLKTHCQTKVSLGLKNLKGCIDMESRMEFHKRGLEHFIAMLNTQIKPNLIIIDGIYAMERGPDFLGTAHRTNLIIAGRDTLSCDLVGATLLGVEPSSVGHLAEFAKLTNRHLDVNSINVRGEDMKLVAKSFEWQRNFEDYFCEANIRGITFQDAGKRYCSGCLVPLESVLVAFSKDNPGIDLEGVEICFGGQVKPKSESKKIFLVGNCSIQANREVKNAIRIPGCPIGLRDTFLAFTDNTVGKQRARKLLAIRFLKNLANRLGIYNEDFPLYKRYNLPEFDNSHFS